MIHYVYVGKFARDGNFIKFQKQADGSLRPVIKEPLSQELFQSLLKENGLTISSIPDEWGLWLDDGFIVCDRISPSRAAIELIRRLATETGCDIADYSSQTLMPPEALAYSFGPQVQSKCGKLDQGNPIPVRESVLPA